MVTGAVVEVDRGDPVVVVDFGNGVTVVVVVDVCSGYAVIAVNGAEVGFGNVVVAVT